MNFRSLVRACFYDLGYPTIREIREYLRIKNSIFADLTNKDVEKGLIELRLEGLCKFVTSDYHAKYRYYLQNKPPYLKKPFIQCLGDNFLKGLKKAMAKGLSNYNDYQIIRDPQKLSKYLITEDEGVQCLDGVYDGEFRFPTIRYRNAYPSSAYFDGWCELIFASYKFYGDSYEKFLKIRAC